MTTSSKNPAQICEDRTKGFPPWLCQRGKTPIALRLGASFRLRFVRKVVIDTILAHFWWILVEPPSPQEFAPLHSQAVGGAPRPLEITPSHDMYLCFDPLFPTDRRPRSCHGSRNFFLSKNRRKIRSKGGVTDRKSISCHSIAYATYVPL